MCQVHSSSVMSESRVCRYRGAESYLIRGSNMGGQPSCSSIPCLSNARNGSDIALVLAVPRSIRYGGMLLVPYSEGLLHSLVPNSRCSWSWHNCSTVSFRKICILPCNSTVKVPCQLWAKCKGRFTRLRLLVTGEAWKPVLGLLWLFTTNRAAVQLVVSSYKTLENRLWHNHS